MMRWIISIQDKIRGITPEQRAMINIRQLLARFGVDVSNLTDDEIKDRIGRFSEAMASTGVTADELNNTFNRVGGILSDGRLIHQRVSRSAGIGC